MTDPSPDPLQTRDINAPHLGEVGSASGALHRIVERLRTTSHPLFVVGLASKLRRAGPNADPESIDVLKNRLSTRGKRARRVVADALVACISPSAKDDAPLFERLLEDRDPRLRRAGFLGLHKLKELSPGAAVIAGELLEDRSAQVQTLAAVYLLKQDVLVREALRTLQSTLVVSWRQMDAPTRERAIESVRTNLVRIHDSTLADTEIESLVTRLLSRLSRHTREEIGILKHAAIDATSVVAQDASVALASQGIFTEASLEHLTEMFFSSINEDHKVGAEHLFQAGKVGAQAIVAHLHRTNLWNTRRTVRALLHFGDDAAPALVESILHADASPRSKRVEKIVSYTLTRLGASALPALESGTLTASPDKERLLLSIMGAIRDRRVRTLVR